MKNDKYSELVDFLSNTSVSENQDVALTDDEKIDAAAQEIMNKYKKAFEELAK
jgi:hypothetical protein